MKLDRDPDVLRFIDWRPPSLEQQHRTVADCLAEYELQPRHGRFVAESPDRDFLGWFSLRVDADPAAPELGYRLRRQAWGRGLATEGARALVQHAFADLAAAEVHAQTMFVNQASRRVLAKCGLRHVETFQLRFCPAVAGHRTGRGPVPDDPIGMAEPAPRGIAATGCHRADTDPYHHRMRSQQLNWWPS